MSKLPFTKMHGAGNDFVVLDGLGCALPPIEPLAARLCDRHLGIGADQLLVVRPSASADFRMEIWNADGSQVEMCANGIRAFYKYLRDRGHTDRDAISVETLSGVVRPRWSGADRVTVDMGRPILAPAVIPLQSLQAPARSSTWRMSESSAPVRLRMRAVSSRLSTSSPPPTL